MVVEEWNKLNKHVVSAGTVDTFKKRLDISMDEKKQMVSVRCTGAANCVGQLIFCNLLIFLCTYNKGQEIHILNISVIITLTRKFTPST